MICHISRSEKIKIIHLILIDAERHLIKFYNNFCAYLTIVLRTDCEFHFGVASLSGREARPLQALTTRRTELQSPQLANFQKEDSIVVWHKEVIKLLSPTMKTQLATGSFSRVLYGNRGDCISQLAQHSLHLLSQFHY